MFTLTNRMAQPSTLNEAEGVQGWPLEIVQIQEGTGKIRDSIANFEKQFPFQEREMGLLTTSTSLYPVQIYRELNAKISKINLFIKCLIYLEHLPTLLSFPFEMPQLD